MAFLARSKKHDLQVLAEELGLPIKPEYKIVHLHKLIIESSDYDEEFTRQFLAAIKEEREKKEAEEKEEKKEREERIREEREQERIREERKQESIREQERIREEREQERIREERKQERIREEREQERIREEREQERIREERDQERIRKERELEREYELKKMELEIRGSSVQPEHSRQISDQSIKFRIHDVMPRFNPKEDEISLFLVSFERQVKIMNIPAEIQVTQLISLLPSDIVQLIAREPEEEVKRYDYVKNLLLQRFKLSAERFRQLFNKHQKSSEGTWYDFYYELKNYLEGWLDGLNIKTFEQLKDLMLVDQIKKRTSVDFKEHFMDEWTTIVSPTEMVKKIEDFEDVRKTIKPKISASQNERNMRPTKSRCENFTKKFEHPYQFKYPPKGNEYQQHKDYHQRDRFQNKNRDNFDRRYRPRCYECGSFDHLKPQCKHVKGNEHLNCISSNDDLLETYTIRGLVNGFEMPILRDTGATVDVISQKFVDYRKMTGEQVWVKYLLNDHLVCLPLVEVEIECDFGKIKTKAAVVTNDLGRYVLGNKTAQLLKDKPLIKLERVNAIFTRSQAKRASEEKRVVEDEKELDEEILDIEPAEEILPPPDEDLAIKDLIKVDYKEFVEAQKQSRELASLISELKIENSNKGKDFKIKENGLLVKRKLDKNEIERELIVVPEKFRDKIKSICHDSTSGHLGIVKTKDRLTRCFYWPNCYKEIEEYVKTCDPCQRVGKSNDKTKAPLTLVPIISEVFSKVNFDACGPLPITPNGNRYLITAICLASKFPDAVPVPDIGSTSIIEAMLQIFSRIGFPKELQTDQGTSFMSKLTVEFLEKFGIKVVRSSVHHPQSNPVERFHRTIKRILKVLCIEAAPDWEKQVPAALFALRTITHESTGFTPSELVYGRNLRTPVTLLYEKWLDSEDEENNIVEYVFGLINRLQRCKELASKKMSEMQTKRKVWYDRKAIKREFLEGDLVLVVSTHKPNRLAVEWKGPGKIEKKLSETNYVVSFEGKEKNQVYHVNMLKPYYKRAEFINLMIAEDDTETEDMDQGFPSIDSEPTVFDFEEMKESSSLSDRLDEKQIQELHDLLSDSSKIFSNKPGKTHLTTHDIQLKENTVIHSKPYRMSPRQNSILREEIDKMLKHKIIEIGVSDYTSPMILVEVAGKEPRPCIDYRKLNSKTKTQYFPLPNIEQRVETVAAAKYITVLDLTKGYWQIPLTPNAQRLATFVTSFGTFKPLRMPFGLKNAPYSFSKMMAELLHSCEHFAVPYLDDVAVFSNTWEEHVTHLHTVLKKIKEAGLTLKPMKCKFAQDKVKYLGHIVGRGIRTPNEVKVKAILDFPIPNTKSEVRAFLGLAGYYNHYIPMFSSIVAPLTETLKGKVRKGKIILTEESIKAFENLKKKLSEQPILHAPDFNKEFILQTDASNTGMGVILAQTDNQGKEHPVLYLSKKFSQVERKYSTTEKECAAIIFAVKKLQCYLDGHTRFMIITDHNPLVWLKNNISLNPRLMRWALFLQSYNYTVIHRSGKNHKNADALSRTPWPV